MGTDFDQDVALTRPVERVEEIDAMARDLDMEEAELAEELWAREWDAQDAAERYADEARDGAWS